MRGRVSHILENRAGPSPWLYRTYLTRDAFWLVPFVDPGLKDIKIGLIERFWSLWLRHLNHAHRQLSYGWVCGRVGLHHSRRRRWSLLEGKSNGPRFRLNDPNGLRQRCPNHTVRVHRPIFFSRHSDSKKNSIERRVWMSYRFPMIETITSDACEQSKLKRKVELELTSLILDFHFRKKGTYHLANYQTFTRTTMSSWDVQILLIIIVKGQVEVSSAIKSYMVWNQGSTHLPNKQWPLHNQDRVYGSSSE